MDLIAIDLVLIPPKETTKSIILLNNKILGLSNSLLDMESFVPHVSIRMGLVYRSQVDKIYHDFQKIAPPQNIKVTKLIKKEHKPGNYRYLLHIENNSDLLKYHNDAMNIKGFAQEKVLPYHFDNRIPINDSSIHYVANFEQYAYQNYWPHITLGLGKSPTKFDPFCFKPVPAVYQLGAECTCSIKL